MIYGDIISLLLILFSIQFPQVPHFLTTDHQTANLMLFQQFLPCEAVQSKLAITQDALNATSARPGSGLEPQI